jgi:hypothetical protein
MEAKMGNESAGKRSAVVRVFTALIFILGAFCCYVVATSVFRLFHNPFENLSPWVNLSMWLNAMLTALFSLVVLYQLFRLVQMIVMGDAFNPTNPRRIRSVAYAVLAISVSNIVFRSLYNYFLHQSQAGWWMVTNVLIKGTEMAFIILGLLIIAKLLETGVRLQQDHNLTI